MAPNNDPVFDFKWGRVKVAVWANQSKTGKTWYNVEIVRAYLAGDAWQDSSKFSRDDLPLVAKAADHVFAWIWEQEHSASASVQVDE